jgi:glycosyltransferase involved in cell wall biosynthesis
MTSLPGLNLIFHSVRQGGGMERHVLDLIRYASERGLPVRVVTRLLDWPGLPPKQVEFAVVPDRTPFARINTFIFESSALSKCHPQWPTIGISRVPGVAMCIVGGTHKGHLIDRGREYHEISRYYDVESEKITTLYPPVSTTEFSLSARTVRDEVRKKIGVTTGQFLLLFPSNNHPLKGADLILEALNNFDPRIKLVVAGKMPLNAPNVINLGFCSDMPALYGAADAVFANTVGAAEVLSEDACIRFDRTVPSLRTALNTALAKFEMGELNLNDPDSHIQYPYTPSQHFDKVFDLLSCTLKR